jgi:nucleotide-binding universal stress UspA family protein
MGRYKKILVAYDGSISGDNALRQAIGMARTEKSWIRVVAVMPPYDGDLELVGVQNISATIHGNGEKLLARAKQIADDEGASILTNLVEGKPYEKIVEVAQSENCDLIVMGRRGTHDIERALMGSVTARVVTYSDRDVLIIPRDAKLGWSKIMLATDGTPASASAAVRAIDLASSYEGKLGAVYAVDMNDEYYATAPHALDGMIKKGKEALEKLKGMALESGIDMDTTLKEGEPYSVIANYAQETGTETIVMGSRGMTGIGRLLMGSVTEKVVGHVNCPVLVAKSQV